MNVIIIDDDYLVVNSLETIVSSKGINVSGVGHTGKDAVELYKKHKPDVVMLDIRMKDMDGIKASEIILEIDPNAKILLITTFQDQEYISSALSLGCRGYILKQNIEGIIPAIKAVYSDNLVFDSNIVSSFKSNSDFNAAAYTDLTQRELDILFLVADGLNNKEIASKLFLSEGTVRNYISTMLYKLALRDRTQLAIYFYKNKDNFKAKE